MKCDCCGKESYVMVGVRGKTLCRDCSDKQYHDELNEKSLEISEPSDFQTWKKRDMSELFWVHLGTYVKEPNERSLGIIDRAYKWACHDNHGLANSFSHAMKWAKIDLHTEWARWKTKD